MNARPYTINVDEGTLRDMRERLARTRWPDEIPDTGWDYGVSADYLKGLVEYWRTDFDWRVHEARLNALTNVQVTVDGLDLHVIHERGRGPDPLPLLITHGWPSSCYETVELIGMLTDPESHGGDPADSFDVIVPSLPGYGFSQRPRTGGMTATRIAAMLVGLMEELGYERFAAHAYDIGASMLSLACVDFPDRIIAYHTTEPANAVPYLGPGSPPLTEAEQDYLDLQEKWYGEEGGYDHIQATRPQTLAYGLNDSPAGLAAWIIDKWYTWTAPPSGDLGQHFTPDQLLANATIYWATDTINSANRLYYERDHHPRMREPDDRIAVPAGITLTTQEIERAPLEYLERIFTDIRYWCDLGQGGHFVMLEEPELLAASLRTFFRMFRLLTRVRARLKTPLAGTRGAINNECVRSRPTRRQLTAVRLGGVVVFGALGWLLLGPLWAFPCALAGLIVVPLGLVLVAEYRQPRPEDLLRAGRPADALRVLDQHLPSDRVLGEKWPSQFREFLARKLVLKSQALQALNRMPQALDAADEAITLLTGKKARRPGAVHASAFCQQGLVLAAMSRHGEALSAVEAAVQLYRDLAICDRNSFLPALAEALTHQADALGFLDRFEEARRASAEALLIRSDMIPALSR